MIHTITGLFDFDRLGWSVGGGGDCNGDGVPDILVGLPLGGNTATTGNVRAYSGATGLLLWASVLGQLDGYRVANTGNVNGDGYADVITSSGTFGLSGSPLAPHVLVLSGTNGATIHSILSYSAGGTSNYDSFGISLVGGVDFNGDGYSDFVVGFSIVRRSRQPARRRGRLFRRERVDHPHARRSADVLVPRRKRRHRWRHGRRRNSGRGRRRLGERLGRRRRHRAVYRCQAGCSSTA